MPVGKVAAVEGHKFQASKIGILGERFEIGEFSPGRGGVLRLHSQEWLCHKEKEADLMRWKLMWGAAGKGKESSSHEGNEVLKRGEDLGSQNEAPGAPGSRV